MHTQRESKHIQLQVVSVQMLNSTQLSPKKVGAEITLKHSLVQLSLLNMYNWPQHLNINLNYMTLISKVQVSVFATRIYLIPYFIGHLQYINCTILNSKTCIFTMLYHLYRQMHKQICANALFCATNHLHKCYVFGWHKTHMSMP